MNNIGGDNLQVGEYAIKASNKSEIMEFLNFNGFTHNSRMDNNPSNREYVIVVNIVHRDYFIADEFFIYPHLTEEEFFKKISYYPKDKIDYKKLFDDEGRLLYEGYVLNDHPYGLGRLYFDNGNIYQEGIFDIKGIRLGKEHYYSGQVKFEGSWTINKGYGPNAPKEGNVYSEDGDLIFTGKFEIKSGGVGWPMIKHPAGYSNIEKNCPKIEYIHYSETEKSEEELPDIYTFIESIKYSDLMELKAERDEFIEKIKENEKKSEAIRYHLYLSQICKMIYEGEFEDGYRR